MKAPLFDYEPPRGAGLLVHPTSLPSNTGIGNLGHSAKELIDFISEAGFSYWQVCPLGPTGYRDSPYQCFSAFAGNPYLIDLVPLQAHKLLSKKDLDRLQKLPHNTVDYGTLFELFWALLEKVYKNFAQSPASLEEVYGSFESFKEKKKSWLFPYACFRALKNHFKAEPFKIWPQELRSFSDAKRSPLVNTLAGSIDAHQFYQYLFFAQWKILKAYAHEKNITIIGDIPIFVAEDSADVWANPKIFDLNKDGTIRTQAGVPPDYFSEDGQLWGNPLYDWGALKKDGYAWWVERLRASFQLYDVIRLDHFRGFDTYWSVDAKAKTARKGAWLKGPGIDFFKKVKQALPQSKFIAEDLGDLTQGVEDLLEETGFSRMAILQFAFGSGPKNPYLPHNHKKQLVVYPGTHDNDTTLGWYNNLDAETKDHVRRYLQVSGDAIAWDIIRACYSSTANLVIIPIQNLLNLGNEARMNFPGKAEGNWQWRYTEDQLCKLTSSTQYLRDLTDLYGRLPAST